MKVHDNNQVNEEKKDDELLELYHLGEFLVSSVIDSIDFEDFIDF